MTGKLPPLSLYVHTPWCVRKCPYCDFNSHEFQSIPEQAYLAALIKDVQQELDSVQGRTLQSIFVGGGTPSVMSGDFYQRLLAKLAELLPFADDIEITMEANPGTTEAARFEAYRAAGINRLSLGVQSFQDPQLKALGRIHGAKEAIRAVSEARKAGFDNLNIDLMHGLPKQSEALAMQDLEQAIALNPSHISWYQLTIEANTAFYSSPPVLPPDDTLWAIQETGQHKLAQAGFAQYEVSAYAKSGKQARHNLNYWQFGDYLGIGAGAHGKVSQLNDKGDLEVLRYRKTRMPEHYLKPMLKYRIGEELVAREDLPFEFMMNVLRLNEGVSEHLFTDRTSLPLEVAERNLSALREKGLLEQDRLAATAQGRLFLNSVLETFAE